MNKYLDVAWISLHTALKQAYNSKEKKVFKTFFACLWNNVKWFLLIRLLNVHL